MAGVNIPKLELSAPAPRKPLRSGVCQGDGGGPQVADADLEMELDIVIRQDVRDLRAALAVQAREHREAAREATTTKWCAS